MRLCYTNEIEISANRIRRKFDEKQLNDLANDIARNGLYHPVVVTEQSTESGEHELPFRLLAGERRLRAIKLLHESNRDFTCDGKHIRAEKKLCPFVLISDISKSDMLEIELHENILRSDLDWRDIVSARAELHDLRISEAESQGADWTVKSTAAELSDMTGMHIGSAERAIAHANAIAPHLDDPMLKHAKSEKDAYKIVRRKVEGELLAALDEQTGSEPTKSNDKLILGDLSSVEIPENYFDLVIADPPYGIGADKFGDAGKSVHGYEDTVENARNINKDILDLAYQCTKEEAHLFLFCDISLFLYLRLVAESTNWKVFRTPLIWYQHTTGRIPWGSESFRRSYELILYANKGGAPLAQLHPDVFHFNIERDAAAVHGARKPVELYKRIMTLCCPLGGKVLDPCCGSGTVFPAARQSRMDAWGIEINPEIYKLARAEFEGEEPEEGRIKWIPN